MGVYDIIDKIPTTRVRIMATVGLIVGTVITWLYHACEVRGADLRCIGWEPSANMLVFLASLAGVDVAQYLSKGMMVPKISASTTNSSSESTDDSGVVTSTDVSETTVDKG